MRMKCVGEFGFSAKRRLLQLICLLICILGNSIYAMSLMDVYTDAVHNDPALNSARAQLQSDNEREPQAMSQLLPNISASYLVNSNQLASISDSFTGFDHVIESSYASRNITLSVKQPLYRPYLWALLKQVKFQQEESDYNFREAEQRLVVRLTEAYLDILNADNHLSVVLSQKAVYGARTVSARKAFLAGLGSRVDVSEAQAQLELARAAEIEARESLSFAQKRLCAMLSRCISSLPHASSIQPNPIPLMQFDHDGWVAKSLENSYYLKSVEAKLRAARLDFDKARSAHYPTLDAHAQYSQSSSENISNPTSRYKNTVVGIQLTVPIYTGGSAVSQVRQALANIDRAQSEYDLASRDLTLRVHKEYKTVVESLSRISALEAGMNSAEDLVKYRKKAFMSGLGTKVDVLNSELMRATVAKDFAQARYSYLASLVRLHALAGIANPGLVADVSRILSP